MFGNHTKILVVGETGFLGKRLVKRLARDGYTYVVGSLDTGLDLRDAYAVEAFFKKEKPEVIMNCAAYVGGIKFNAEHEGEIFYNNTLLNLNLQEAARKYGVRKLINPIANCSYPDVAQKDFKEYEWWDGPLHPSVMVYGFTKKATWVNAYAYFRQYGIQSTHLLIPNMYGPEDHFDEVRSHAMGALIMKIIKAKEKGEPHIDVWGSGSPVREWLYIDDCVDAFVRILNIDTGIEPLNIGQGIGISIKEMAEKICYVVGYEGKLVFDATRPDGAAYKVMNIERMKKILNWMPPTSLDQGIRETVAWYYDNVVHKAQ